MLPSSFVEQGMSLHGFSWRTDKVRVVSMDCNAMMEAGDLPNAAQLIMPARWNQHEVDWTTTRSLGAR